MIPGYFDKEGKPITDVLQWAKLFEDYEGYRRIGRFDKPWVCVSTVWLGIDHNWGGGKPILFESMVFAPGLTEVCQIRYATVDEAKAGHAKLVKKYGWRIDLFFRGRFRWRSR